MSEAAAGQQAQAERPEAQRTEAQLSEAQWPDALPLDDLWEGDMTGVTIDGKDVLLVNVDGQVRAYQDRCPHQAWKLHEGDLDGSRLTCVRHMWVFDAVTGAGINPDDAHLTAYPCTVDSEGIIRVDIR